MTAFLRVPLLVACAALAVLVPASVTEACWCSRVYTRSYSSYCDPCVSCPTVVRSYYAPVLAPPVVAACPTTACSTTNVERCYYEAQTSYASQTQLEPQVSYVRRSYYDPLTCCYRSYLEPTTQYVARNYLVPVTNWVKRCAIEPVTTCTTSASYYVPTTVTASYWTPDGIVYYPTVVTTPSCPVPTSTPATNGATQRGSEYSPATDSKNSTDSPIPKPMPGSGRSDGARRTGTFRSGPVARSAPALSAPVRRTTSVPPRFVGSPVFAAN